ncbi:MAG TPA: class I SAM-dependent methyltransferase [Pseudonocardia sp.]|nr:class I SAM-dependent methyltransferase [Pseudonocardia sp.]
MLAELRRRLPSVDARAGSAEAIPLPDASVDAVLIGQAWHWFDLDRALPELARVLRPGGVLAALWTRCSAIPSTGTRQCTASAATSTGGPRRRRGSSCCP